MSLSQDLSGIPTTASQDPGVTATPPTEPDTGPIAFRWVTSTPTTIRNAAPTSESSPAPGTDALSSRAKFIGPKRPVGRPPKSIEPRPVGRPPKPTPLSNGMFMRLGRIVVPGTHAQSSGRLAPIFASSQAMPTIAGSAAAPDQSMPALADVSEVDEAPPTSTPIQIIPDVDSNRPIHNLAEDDDGSNDYDDGTGLGEEDEDDDEDDTGEDGMEVLKEPGNSATAATGSTGGKQRKSLRPMPPWLEEAYKKYLKAASIRDGRGRPALYSTEKTFFFPRESTFFLLRDGVTPEKLYNPRFMLWDPECLCRIPCPNCGHSLTRHSAVPRPRRVVDMDSSFWIIGYRYRCRECVNPKTNKKGTLTFRSWNPKILSALPSYIAEEFPAVLTHRSGISKVVLKMLRSAITSGMGPKKFSDALRSHHLLQYDTLQLQYLEFINERVLDEWTGARYRAFLPFDDRSPHGPHGFVPSAVYLRDVYDSYIEDHRHAIDQHTAMRSCRVGAIDHSHKFPKHIAQVNGERVFTGLLTVTNELGEIRLCVLVATKAHSAFEYALIMLRESLRLYGHQQPEIFYTDNMSDRNLLESAFPSLRAGVTPVERYSSLPLLELPDTIRVEVKDTRSAIDSALSTIVDDIPIDDGAPHIVIGFDAEWNVEMRDTGVFVRGEIAVVQIAYKNKVYILQISDMICRGYLPDMLVILLSNPRVLKVGRLVNSDLRQLQDGIKRATPFPGAIDLAKYAKDRCVVSNARCSLADICAKVLEKRMNKNVSERTCTAWERRKLTDEQIRYAALDAYAPLKIYERLSAISVPQKLQEPLQPLAPVLLYNADSTTVIARGRLAHTPRPEQYSDVKLRKSTHILVEILEVYVPGAIISSHKKQALSAFGLTPFFLVCLQSRTRSYDPLPSQLPPNILTHDIYQTASADTSHDTPGAEAGDGTDLLEEIIVHDEAFDADVNIDPRSTADLLHQLDSVEDQVIDYSMTETHNRILDVDVESQKEGDRLLSALRAEPWPTETRSRILKDIFHVFNMLQLSATHSLRKEFAFVLRDALLIPDNEDRARIDQYGSTLNPPQTFEQLRASRSSWVWRRCRRVIPPPEELYSFVERVFSTYGPLKDEKTQKPLFSPHNWRAAVQILELARNGSLSDPPDVALYVVIGVDAKSGNLPIYRCVRGTNSTEGGVHTHLRKNLPTSGASFRHTDNCLADFVLHKNLLVGTFNSTGQKFRSHSYIWVTNRLQELLISVEDKLVNPTHISGWVNGNLYVQTKESIGIIAVPRELQEQSGISAFNRNIDGKQRHAYLARKQNTHKAILPVHTPAEHKLFHDLIRNHDAFTSQSSGPRWPLCVRVWNVHADTDNDIYYKLSEQLSAYYKAYIARLNVKHTKLVTLTARKPIEVSVRSLERAQKAPPVRYLTFDDIPKIPSSGFKPVTSEANPAANAAQDMCNDVQGAAALLADTPTTTSSTTPSHNPATAALSIQPDNRGENLPLTPEETRAMMERLSRQRVAEAMQAKKPSKKARKPRSCRRCGSTECKGKNGDLSKCNNPCQDCGKVQECEGRDLQSNPDRPCWAPPKAKGRNKTSYAPSNGAESSQAGND